MKANGEYQRKQLCIYDDILKELELIKKGEKVQHLSTIVNKGLQEYIDTYNTNKNFNPIIVADIKEVIKNQFERSYDESAEVLAKIALNTLQTRYILEEMLMDLEIDESILEKSREKAVYDLRRNYPYQDLIDYFKKVHNDF